MITVGDIRNGALDDIADESIDACVTDPPYDLTQRSATTYKSASPGRYKESTPGGFMGLKWDGSGVAFDPATWREVYRVLKPGAHLLAFGGTRTFHRMTVAIEDAGFEVRDCLSWLYGSGFPKSHNVANSIDKSFGHGDRGHRIAVANRHHPDGTREPNGDILPPYQARTPEGEPWEGWGTALKPAWEPIIMARKPLTGTVAANVLAYGTGAINVDGCRIQHNEPIRVLKAQSGGDKVYGQGGRHEDTTELKESGRWPANVILDEAVAETAGEWSRYFYTAKASSAERSAGLDGMPDVPSYMVENGSKTSGLNGKRYDRTTVHKNPHPTVKPISLMRYLVRLVCPPGGIVLDPFMGSGTTGIAAALEQMQFEGRDLSPEYVEIARKRIAHWSASIQPELL